MNPKDAEEYTQALGLIVAGGWRQIALGKRLGVPKALQLSVDEWVKQRLGGYVRMNLEERREAEIDLKAQGFSNREIADVIGVDHETVRRDLAGANAPVNAKALGKTDGTGANAPLDMVAVLTASDEVRKQIDADERRAKRDEDRAATRAATAAAAAAAPPADVDSTVLHNSFIDVANGLDDDSVDLVFTDPPYHDRTLPLYGALSLAAAKVLKDGASLITYTSHHRLPEVIALLESAGLTFFWPLAMIHTGAKARMTEYGIVVHWKPLLWFVKGTFRSRVDMRFVNDLIESAPEKDSHPWQQGTIEARYYIEALTQPGDLVFDPFCGGGTTAVAAAQTGRRWLTCDIDEESVWIARQRLREVV